jgi:hypothetical protein
LIGCQSEKSGTEDIPVIDFSKNYPEKRIRLQDVADIEYIPLETTDDVLLGTSYIISVTDRYIVIGDLSQDEIFIFNRRGKVVSHYNRRGQGPQEYITLGGHVIFDGKNEEVIHLHMPKSEFLVYSMSGEFKRSFKHSNNWLLNEMYDFDDETMLVCNGDRWIKEHDYSEKPYMLLSKKDGSIVSVLDIRLPVRYTNQMRQEIDMGGGKKGYTASNILIYNNPYDGQNLVIANISSDTVYRLTPDRKLIPILVRTPSVHSSEPPTVWGVPLTTDKFMILYRKSLDLIAYERGKDSPGEYLMYEFETGQTSKIFFEHADLWVKDWNPSYISKRDVPKNTFVHLLPPHALNKEYYDEKQRKGEPVKIPDEEDNPILAIYKFK